MSNLYFDFYDIDSMQEVAEALQNAGDEIANVLALFCGVAIDTNKIPDGTGLECLVKFCRDNDLDPQELGELFEESGHGGNYWDFFKYLQEGQLFASTVDAVNWSMEVVNELPASVQARLDYDELFHDLCADHHFVELSVGRVFRLSNS